MNHLSFREFEGNNLSDLSHNRGLHNDMLRQLIGRSGVVAAGLILANYMGATPASYSGPSVRPSHIEQSTGGTINGPPGTCREYAANYISHQVGVYCGDAINGANGVGHPVNTGDARPSQI